MLAKYVVHIGTYNEGEAQKHTYKSKQKEKRGFINNKKHSAKNKLSEDIKVIYSEGAKIIINHCFHTHTL